MSSEYENRTVLNFRNDNYREVLRIANELAELEDRKPHDSIRILVEEDGQKKIDRLKAEKEANPDSR